MHFIGTATAITVTNPTPPGYTPPPIPLQRISIAGLSGQTALLFPITAGQTLYLTQLTVSWANVSVAGMIQVVDVNAPILTVQAGAIDNVITVPYALLPVGAENPGFRVVSNNSGGSWAVTAEYYTQLP